MSACGDSKTQSPGPAGRIAPAATPATEVAPALHETGKLIAKQPVAGTASDTYAYYLPKSYRADQAARIVIFLDAHARGQDPVEMYKPLAEEFGFLLFGSNVSKNGQLPAESLVIYDALLRDIKAKFKIDDKHITVAGFSGGARVAASLAQSRPGLVQVIGCSAGFQPREGDAFGYFGIAGLEDFNYWEMYDLENALQGMKQPYAFQFFPGGHAWPPPNVMQNALEFSYFKWADVQKPNDSLATLRMKSFQSELNAAQHAFDYFWQMRAYEAVIGAMGGWLDLAKEKDGLAKLRTDKFFLQAKTKLDASRDIELKMRNEYVPQLGTRTVDEWRKIAADLRDGKISHPGADHFTDLRVLNFMSLNTYFQVAGAQKAGDLAAMEHFLLIYAAVDPGNSEHAYITAVLRLRQNRPTDAIASLKQARVIGFKDAERMASDPDLAGLRRDPAFEAMLGEMRAQ